MKTVLLLATLILSSSLGEILSAKGMQKVGDVSLRPRAFLRSLWKMVRSPYLFAGVACMAVSFFSFISLLSYADLSFVVPLTAVAYITNTLGARFFLHERISRERWMGTLLVAFGVCLISISNRAETYFQNSWTHELTNYLTWALRVVLLLLVLAAMVYHLFAAVAGLLWFADRRRQRALGVDYSPPISILKPVRGADAGAYENFASFCRQDYPEFQIVFGVREESDPAIPIIRQLQREFPAVEIELVIDDRKIGHNAKVSNLYNLYSRAKHELLLIADSDIRVTPDYLRRVAAPMQEERVGMVTCLYRGEEATTLGGLLENIGISSTFGPEVCSSRALEGIAFALGSTIVLRRGLLEKLGGFAAIADYLTDDFVLGNWTAREGYEIILSDYVVAHISGPATMAEMLRHQVRWGRSIRIMRPWGYRGLILTYGTATSLLSLPLWDFSSFAWGLVGMMLLVRFLPVFLIGLHGLKDRVLARWFWLVPLRDLISFLIWLGSFRGNHIHWRGIDYRVLPDGKLEPVLDSNAKEAKGIL